ncbi:MAG TPA: alpha/beta fold hydrolase [Hyphomicrobium sp.]|nr:alpha/beta fold hydrolase [Hyphomicrobium sp.]
MKSVNKFQPPRGSLFIPGGPTGVLLLHSLGGSPLELKFVAQSLARQGHTVYCPVIPGLTFGTDVSGMSTWRDWFDAADQAFDDLKKSCDTIIVGGASAGAVLALRLAAFRDAETSAVILFAPTLAVNGWAIPKTIKLFHLVSDKWTARLFKLKTPAPHGIKDERVRNFALEAMKGDGSAPADITARSGGTVYEFMRLVRNVKPMLSKITQHTLIFHPRYDDQSDMKNTMTLQRKLSGMVEVCVLEDSYHLVTLDRQRGYVAERSIDFVERVMARIIPAQKPVEVRPQVSKQSTGAAE